MSYSFEQSLRRKSYDQLMNMLMNKANWTEEQYAVIVKVADAKGVYLKDYKSFSSEDETEIENDPIFEKDMKVLTDLKRIENQDEGWKLASVIVSITSFLFSVVISVLTGFQSLYVFVIIAIGLVSIIFHIKKLYKVAVIIGALALLILVINILFNGENNLVFR